MRKRLSKIISLAALAALLAACGGTATPAETPTAAPPLAPTAVPPTPTPAPTATPRITPTATPIPVYGPSNFPDNVDPLTGLTVDDPAVLNRRPLLIKVSDFPPVVRPQSGLSFADQVWEHIVEGWRYTRFTAVFYSQTPENVGSVRSGRLPDLELVPMYKGLYYASGFSSNSHDPGGPPRMRELMRAAPWFNRNFSGDFGYGEPYAVRVNIPGVAYEHTLFAVPAEMWKLADQKNVNQRQNLDGFVFDVNVPDGGTPTTEVDIKFPVDGPKDSWHWDEASGTWLYWVDDQPLNDFLTGKQLSFENVVVVYAEHYEADFIEYESSTVKLNSVGATLEGEGTAVLLRDGQRFDVTWKRPDINSMMQFYDANGNLIAFKPGKTWFNLVPTNVFPPKIDFLP